MSQTALSGGQGIIEPGKQLISEVYRQDQKELHATGVYGTMGAQFAMMPTEIPDRGTFAIYFHGGVQFGLWEK